MEAPGMRNITQSGIETQSDPLVTVTVSGEFSECPGMHAICVRHSHLPEVYGEGETTQEAAEDLLRQLLSSRLTSTTIGSGRTWSGLSRRSGTSSTGPRRQPRPIL